MNQCVRYMTYLLSEKKRKNRVSNRCFSHVIIFDILLLLYIKRKYFTHREPIPGSPPHLLFGKLIETGQIFRGTSLAEGFLQFKKRFGDVFQFWLGPSHVTIVGNINDVQHIFDNQNIYDQSDMFVQQTSDIL
jgi:hypothetical protein